jgi:pyruvate dehydrogenase E1 component beta subunit
MTELKLWQAVNTALGEELERDPRVVMFGEDVGKAGGPFGASRGLRDRFGEKRVRDTPIAEGAITGVAVGAAMSGLRPVVEIMFFDFVTLAMDQLVNQAAKMRYMSGGKLSVPMTVLTFAGSGRGSGPQHSQSLEAWLAHVPGLSVVYPSNPADAKGLLKAAIRSDDPVVFIESSRLWTIRGEVPEAGDHVVPIGRAAIVRPGSDVTLVSWGWAAARTLEAAAILADAGVDAEVIDLRTLRPLDTETVLESVARTHRAVVIDEGWRSGSLAAEVVARIVEGAFWELDAPVERVCSAEVPMPYARELELAALPSAPGIVDAAVRVMSGG